MGGVGDNEKIVEEQHTSMVAEPHVAIPAVVGGNTHIAEPHIAIPTVAGSEPPEPVKKLVGLLVDYNLTMDEVDIEMMKEYSWWKLGDARSKVAKHELLARTVAEGKALALRKAGADKVDSIKRYVEAQAAVGVTKDGVEFDDHGTRIKASDRILTLMGESPVVVAKTEVNVDARTINIDGETVAEFIRAIDRLQGYETVECDQTGER